MTITSTRSLSLSGELDMASEPDLLLRITALAEPGTTVELDLSGVTFMDSSALRGLVNAQWDAQAAGGDVTISAASPLVRRLLDITGLGAQFGLSET